MTTKGREKGTAAARTAVDKRFPARLLTAIAIATATVLAPLLAFSEATIKSILDRWLSQCLVVVDLAQHGSDAPMARLYAYGNLPAEIPITFVVDQGQIDRISLVNHVEQATTAVDANLLVHPQANQRCPGALCPESQTSAERMTLRIKPFGSNYLYQLRVLTTPALQSLDDLKAYVQPRAADTMQCRVEKATPANYLARQPKLVQIAILFGAVVLLTLLMAYLKKPKGDEA
jgi:hypothetical protein